MSSTRIIITIGSLCLSTTCMVLSNMFLIMMIGELNRKRGEDNLMSYFGFTFPKVHAIFREYRALYPKGKLDVYTGISFGVAMAALLCMAVAFRIIG